MRTPVLETLLLLGSLATTHAADVLKTNGFSSCLESDEVKVERMNIQYDKKQNVVTFDVAGISKKSQSIIAELVVNAYGIEVYKNSFDPCDENIALLCPIPEGNYNATGSLPIPKEYLDKIPAIAFSVPDLDGVATLKLKAKEGDSKTGGKDLACLQSTVDNGKSANLPSVSYITAGIAAAALGLSALGAAAGAASGGGTGTASPSFADVMGWFQFIAMSGMNSVSYPPVYRSFANNFGWSTGQIPWEGMQRSIDNFRKSTGGNLTENSVDFLKKATLIFADSSADASTIKRRSVNLPLWARDLNVNGQDLQGTGGASNVTEGSENKIMHQVKGIQAYVEKLMIPEGNTFMNVLLVFLIVVASVAVLILLFKVILEAWALCASFPQSLRGFRKRYWLFLASTIVRIILILYGTWVLYCMFQFRRGDSWGVHVLAGVTLAVFTGVLAFFIVKIVLVARKAKKTEGGAAALYENKPYMRKYGLFYDQFKQSYWWIFVPLILYAFLKGSFIALGDGHGLTQVGGQLACEALLLILLLWSRPFNTKTGNVLNIIISVVRVLSVLCLLIFVHELGVAANTKTIMGVVLIVVQSVLTAALAILLAVNAIFIMCKKDPRKKNKEELEKGRDLDTLTPLDPRQSFLRPGDNKKGYYQPTPTQESFLPAQTHSRSDSGQYRSDSGTYSLQQIPTANTAYSGAPPHSRMPSSGSISNAGLIQGAAPVAVTPTHNPTHYDSRLNNPAYRGY